MHPVVVRIISTKGRIGRSVATDEVSYAPDERTHRTGERVAAATVGDDLSFDAVLLGSKGEGD